MMQGQLKMPLTSDVLKSVVLFRTQMYKVVVKSQGRTTLLSHCQNDGIGESAEIAGEEILLSQRHFIPRGF